MMSEHDVAERVMRLRGYFPNDFTPEKGAYLAAEFRRWDITSVDRAIQRYAELYTTLSLAPLISLVRGMVPLESGALQESKRWKKNDNAERKSMEAVLPRGEGELRKLLEVVLEGLPDASRPFYRNRNPLSDVMVRKMIYHYLRKSASAA